MVAGGFFQDYHALFAKNISTTTHFFISRKTHGQLDTLPAQGIYTGVFLVLKMKRKKRGHYSEGKRRGQNP